MQIRIAVGVQKIFGLGIRSANRRNIWSDATVEEYAFSSSDVDILEINAVHVEIFSK